MKEAIRKQPARFAEADLDGEIVLMDQDGGRFVTLRATAAAIWALIDGERDTAAIRAELHRRYAGPTDAIDRDLDTFLAQLRERGFVA